MTQHRFSLTRLSSNGKIKPSIEIMEFSLMCLVPIGNIIFITFCLSFCRISLIVVCA